MTGETFSGGRAPGDPGVKTPGAGAGNRGVQEQQIYIIKQMRRSPIEFPAFVYPTKNFVFKIILESDRTIDAAPYRSHTALTSRAVYIFNHDTLRPVRGLWIVPARTYPTFAFNSLSKIIREDLTNPDVVQRLLEKINFLTIIKNSRKFLIEVDNYGVRAWADFRPAPWIKAKREYSQGRLTLAYLSREKLYLDHIDLLKMPPHFFNHDFPENAEVYLVRGGPHNTLFRFIYLPEWSTIYSPDHPHINVPPGFYLTLHPPEVD